MAEANNQSAATEVGSTATEATMQPPTNEATAPPKPTMQTVDDRPKKQEDPKETEQRCKSALLRSGRDVEAVYALLTPEEREELASLDRAYPEGAMFLRAADNAFRQMRDRKAKQAS